MLEVYLLLIALAAMCIGACHLPTSPSVHMVAAAGAVVFGFIDAVLMLVTLLD